MTIEEMVEDWEASFPPEPTDGRLFIVIGIENTPIGPVVRKHAPENATALAKQSFWLPNKEYVRDALFSPETQVGDVIVWYCRLILVRHR